MLSPIWRTLAVSWARAAPPADTAQRISRAVSRRVTGSLPQSEHPRGVRPGNDHLVGPDRAQLENPESFTRMQHPRALAPGYAIHERRRFRPGDQADEHEGRLGRRLGRGSAGLVRTTRVEPHRSWPARRTKYVALGHDSRDRVGVPRDGARSASRRVHRWAAFREPARGKRSQIARPARALRRLRA